MSLRFFLSLFLSTAPAYTLKDRLDVGRLIEQQLFLLYSILLRLLCFNCWSVYAILLCNGLGRRLAAKNSTFVSIGIAYISRSISSVDRKNPMLVRPISSYIKLLLSLDLNTPLSSACKGWRLSQYFQHRSYTLVILSLSSPYSSSCPCSWRLGLQPNSEIMHNSRI